MATSGVDTYSPNQVTILKSALELIGHIRPGGRPNAEDLDACMAHLNAMLKSWSTLTAGIWLQDDVSITLVDGTASYTTPGRYHSIIEARVRDDDGYDRVLQLVGVQEYQEIPNKVTEGMPNMLYYQRTATGGIVYTWPVIDDSGYTLELTVKRQLQDMIAYANTFDLPPEWMEAVTYGLASRIGIIYGADPNRMSQIKMQAAESLQVAMWSDQEETSVFIQPEMGGF